MSYGETVSDKAKGDRSLTERIAMFIPGYRGYRDKNIRREVDKEVRREVVRSIEGAKSMLSDIHRQIIKSGQMDLAKDVERIRTKTDTYLKSIESAESGYSAIWDTVKVLKDELNAVVEWDAKLLDESAELRDKTANVIDMIDNGDSNVGSLIRKIERYIDDLVDGLNERIKAIKGLNEE